MVSARKTLGAIILIFSLDASLMAAPKGRFELRGLVVFVPPQDEGNRRATVRLTGTTEPYFAETRTDPKGNFRFGNLLPRSYDLTVTLPTGVVARQTVEVTPSFASAKGIVSINVKVERDRPPNMASTHVTVSVRELSIPDAAWDEYARAKADLEKYNVEAATRHLEKAVAQAPQFVEALNLLGTICFQTQQYAQAEKYFRQALAHDPNAFAPLVNLGGTLLSLRRIEEALPVNQKAVAAQPDDVLANAQLGMCYLALKNYDEARKYLEKAQALDPGHFTCPQLPLAEIYEHQGAKAEAIRELQDFLARHPDSPRAGEVREKIRRLQ